MEQAVLPAEPQDAGDGQPRQSDASRLISRANRANTLVLISVSGVAPILYLLFINHYASNSFFNDDWTVVALIHAALHGRLSLSQLWGQYNESRLFIGNVVDVLFGFIDRFDLRSVIFFSAAMFIASYAVLLVLAGKYLGRRLTPISILAIGITWFSLADVENSLWAFQVSWYLTVFFFVLMLFALFVPGGRRTLWFAVAAIAALSASLSTIQGFLCWPLGAICILWIQPRGRRAFGEFAAWIGAMAVSVGLYLPGFDFTRAFCQCAQIGKPLPSSPQNVLGFFSRSSATSSPADFPLRFTASPASKWWESLSSW